MATKSLGLLQPVDLRQVWPNEESDFTPWLADEENLAILADTLGMPLEFVSREEAVGPYSADILCRDSNDGTPVVVENQDDPSGWGPPGCVAVIGGEHSLIDARRADSEPERMKAELLATQARNDSLALRIDSLLQDDRGPGAPREGELRLSQGRRVPVPDVGRHIVTTRHYEACWRGGTPTFPPDTLGHLPGIP